MISDRLNDIKNKWDSLKIRRDLLLENKEKAELLKTTKEKELYFNMAAFNVAHTVAQEIQKHISQKLSEISTLMEESLYGKKRAYEIFVEINSTTSGGGVEASIHFERDGKRFQPVLPSGSFLAGGGPIEIAAFGIRIALWSQSLGEQKTRPIFLMDEPFRFTEPEVRGNLLDFLNLLSRELSIQIIYITHEKELQAGYNTHFENGKIIQQSHEV